MRKLVNVAAAVSLVAGLILVFSPSTSSAAPTTQDIGSPMLGSLAQNGGPAGWAANQSAAIQAAGSDPARVGQAGQSAAITMAINGPSATISLARGATGQVGAVVGDGTGKVTVWGNNAQLRFTSSPQFFTPEDLMKLMPRLGFSVVTYSKEYPYRLQSWGHYSVSVVDESIIVDDKTTDPATIKHPPITERNRDRMNKEVLSGDYIVGDQVKEAITSFVIPGTAILNEGLKRVFTGYSEAMPFSLGSASLTFSFGYLLRGLTSGQSAKLNLSDVTEGSWFDELETVSGQVPASFNSLDWNGAMTLPFMNAINKAGLLADFESIIDDSLSYDQLASVIEGRTDAQMATELEVMVDEMIASVDGYLSQWEDLRIDNIEGYENWYGELRMDQILGQTHFLGVSQAPLEMYPTIKQDLMKSLGDEIQKRVRSWRDLVTNSVTGSITLSSTFTPTAITTLVPTDVQVTAPTNLPTVSPTASPTDPPATVGPIYELIGRIIQAFINVIRQVLGAFLGFANVATVT